MRDRYILLCWHLVMAIPFTISLTMFHWLFTFNKAVAYLSGDLDWTIFILPTIVTLVVVGIAIVFPSKIIRNSIFNSGFFFKPDKRQELARALYAENIVIRKKIANGKEKQKFPEIYYHQGVETDIFTFRTGREFHDLFYEGIEKKLEQVFLANLIEREVRYKYVSYHYLVDTISKRLNFSDTKVEDGVLTLMKGLEWDFEEMPHMLITGGTGGGKTYFIYTLIALLGKIGRVHIADPKRSDLTHLEKFNAFTGLVASENEDIQAILEKAVDLMEKRFKYMNDHPNQKMGKNYRYYKMPPEFFIVDEWGAFISVLNHRQEQELYDKISPLVLKARQAGIFLIIATQKAGTDVLKSMIRDNLMCKVSLGSLSATGYEMTFGDGGKTKVFYNKPKVKGRGYIDVGNGVVQEFYAPFVLADFSFEEYFAKMSEMPYLDLSDVRLTVEEREDFKQQFEAEKKELERMEKANGLTTDRSAQAFYEEQIKLQKLGKQTKNKRNKNKGR